MGRPIQHKFVANSQIITSAAVITTTAASPYQLTNPFPVGDLVYQDLNLRFSGNLNCATGGGSVVTDGGLRFIRSVYFSTPQHQMVVEDVDGILLNDMMEVIDKTSYPRNDVTGTGAATTPTFNYALKLPFKDLMSFNASDLGLDVLRSGNPLLQINTGVYTDFVSGGAAADSVQAFTMESHLRMDPGPVTDPDLPTEFMPYMGKLTFPVSTTVAQQQIFLAFGDRIYKRIFVTQRNSSTNARLNNTIVGVNDTDRLSLKINSNFPWVDRVEWLALQYQNCIDYRRSAMPNGVAVIDFVKQILGGVDPDNPRGGSAGPKLSDALSVLSKNQGTLELDIDVTTVSNGTLRIGYDAVKILPLGARRPAPAPASPARA